MQEEFDENYCTLWIVRHGQTEWNLQGIVQGPQKFQFNRIRDKTSRRNCGINLNLLI